MNGVRPGARSLGQHAIMRLPLRLLPTALLALAGALIVVPTATLAGPAVTTARKTQSLTEPAVRALIAEVVAASKARDVEHIGRLLATDCSIVFAGTNPDAVRLGALSKAEYLARLTDGYTALGDLQSYDYQASDVRVHLNAAGTQAIVDADIAERLTFNDHELVTHSHEASVVELRDGSPKLVRVTGTVTGTSR